MFKVELAAKLRANVGKESSAAIKNKAKQKPNDQKCF